MRVGEAGLGSRQIGSESTRPRRRRYPIAVTGLFPGSFMLLLAGILARGDAEDAEAMARCALRKLPPRLRVSRTGRAKARSGQGIASAQMRSAHENCIDMFA